MELGPKQMKKRNIELLLWWGNCPTSTRMKRSATLHVSTICRALHHHHRHHHHYRLEEEIKWDVTRYTHKSANWWTITKQSVDELELLFFAFLLSCLADWQKNRQTDRQKDGQTDRHTDIHTQSVTLAFCILNSAFDKTTDRTCSIWFGLF